MFNYLLKGLNNMNINFSLEFPKNFNRKQLFHIIFRSKFINFKALLNYFINIYHF